MSEHTPGPWEAHGYCVQVPAAEYRTLAAIKHPFARAVGSREDTECLANARLVAAAPDLLKALETIMFGLPKVLTTCPKKTHVLQTYKECAVGVERARAAISSAKGAK